MPTATPWGYAWSEESAMHLGWMFDGRKEGWAYSPYERDSFVGS
jgi:hypothetical protein